MSSFFDDQMTLAMGAAFDQACNSLGTFARANSARANSARELIAKKIIDAVIEGERDPARLHSAGLQAICLDNPRMPVIDAP